MFVCGQPVVILSIWQMPCHDFIDCMCVFCVCTAVSSLEHLTDATSWFLLAACVCFVCVQSVVILSSWQMPRHESNWLHVCVCVCVCACVCVCVCVGMMVWYLTLATWQGCLSMCAYAHTYANALPVGLLKNGMGVMLCWPLEKGRAMWVTVSGCDGLMHKSTSMHTHLYTHTHTHIHTRTHAHALS
jgi:hypothetical protein